MGDSVAVLPSGKVSTIARIGTADGDLEAAPPGRAVVVTLADDIDVGRGDVLCAAQDRPEASDQFAAHLVWMECARR